MIAIFLFFYIVQAHAHDDRITVAKDPHTGQDCCGPNACRAVSVERVAAPKPGYVVPDGTFIPAETALPSDDGQFWQCKHGSITTCFFAPITGW